MLLFFDISGGEIFMILLVSLIFFGSKGIPDVARTLGRTMRQVRDAGQDVQREIRKGASDIKKTLNEEELPRPGKKDDSGE
jgi:sec-independent protein translocase protein TatA